MKQKIIYIIAFTFISLNLSSQTIKVGMTKQMVDSILNYPEKVDTVFYNSHEAGYVYKPDMGVLFYKGKVDEIVMNYSISCWLTYMSNALDCGVMTTTEIDPIELRIYPIGNYYAGDQIVVNCDIINRSESKHEIYNKDSNYYNKRDINPAFFLAVITDTSGYRRCKGLHDCSTTMAPINVNVKDYYKLKPKEKITKQINITNLVYGCNCSFGTGLMEGYYEIKVRYMRYWSNTLKIQVKKNN